MFVIVQCDAVPAAKWKPGKLYRQENAHSNGCAAHALKGRVPAVAICDSIGEPERLQRLNDMTLFPISLRLEGRQCLVVGAGRIASAKASGLLSCGAKVVVVGPQAAAWVRDRARAGKLVWRRRTFTAGDLRGAFLVVAATDSLAVNEAVFRACAARGVLCNVVDDPEHCHFFYSALMQRGSLQIAISTGGHSPALASRLRKELEKQFGPEWGLWVDYLGKMRRQILSSEGSVAKKRKLLLQIASAEAFQAFLDEQTPERKKKVKTGRPR